MPSLNVGEYIDECISSVTNQTLKEIEIICIDAGSTDNTLDILKKHAKKDSRITILNSNEKSYGHQVNMGLERAKGEYISIIETDDFIDENMLEALYSLSDNGKVDLIKSTFYHYDDWDKNNIKADIDNSKADLPNNKQFTLKEEPLFVDGHPSVWSGIYKRSFLEENRIKMVEAPAGGWVDNPFFYETAIAAKSIVYTHQAFYYYRVSNPNSSSNQFSDFSMPMQRVLDMFNILDKYNFKDENVLVKFYNRLFRYVEIILENNDNSDENLDYETCAKIHEVMQKVDENIVMKKLKFNFQKIYLKYISPLFLARFEKPEKLTDEDYELLFKENKFLHTNVAYFRTQYNETNYQKSQLEKKLKEEEELLTINKVSIAKKPKIETVTPKPKVNIEEIKNKKEKSFSYTERESKYPVSVIMPVFNGEEFLERSMASLLKQTLENFEIVFIDDGSTDNSLKILKEYEKKYDFVNVLTQENSGSGKARNYGINEAQGEYIAFLDADDFFIDADALEKMYDIGNLNNADMVTANIKHDVDNQGEFKPWGPFPYYQQNDVILPEQYGIPWSFYKNIFKRDFLVENNIYFPDLLRGQDPVFLAEALTKVDKVYVAATDLYAYVYNSDTAKASNPRKLYDQLLHYRQVIDYLDIPKFYRRRTEYFVKIILFCSRIDDDSIVDAIESIRDIFKDMPDFLRRLEDYIFLKFRHVPEVNEMIDWPEISVIMDVHNSEKFFEKTINSLIGQKMNDFELILIDGFDDGKFEYVKHLLKDEPWVKFIENDNENMISLRKKAFDDAEGDYIFFCDDTYIFENNLFEDMLERTLVEGSDVCLCNVAKGGANKNREINFRNILGNQNYLYYTTGWEKIIPHIFTSSFEKGCAIYKKALLNDLFAKDDLIGEISVLQIKAILSALKISILDKFSVNYLTKDNIYYSSRMPEYNANPLNIFNICDDVEEFLKEKSLYDDLKTYFDIYKINQITSALDSVRYIGCYSYNDPRNRDLYANNDIALDYSQYYGSKSEHVGLDYSYANEYFIKTKEEFNNLDYRDLRFLDLNANRFSDSDNLIKYNAVLKSDSYEEYMDIANFSRVEELRARYNDIKRRVNDAESKKEKLSKESEKVIEENTALENKLKNELKELESENQKLNDENNRLREEYWENREIYDYILASKSWKYTRWMRKD